MRIRKLGAVAVVAGAALVVGACGSSKSDSSSGTSTSASKGKSYTVAFVKGYTADEYYTSQECGFRAEAERLGITPIVDGAAEFDPTKQTPVLQAVIRKKPDAIAIDATDAKAMIAPLQQAVNAKIPVLTTGDTVDAPLPFTFISADQEEGGRLAAQEMQKLLPDGGKVLVVGIAPGITSGDGRQKGFIETLEGDSKFEVLPVQYSNNDQTKAASIVSATLRAHPDLAGVFGVNIVTAQGTVNALRLARKTGEVKAIGFDAAPQEITALERDELQAVISQNPRNIGRLVVQNAKRYLDGARDIPKVQPSPPVVINRDNLDSPEAQAALYVGTC